MCVCICLYLSGIQYVHGLTAQPWEEYLDGEYDENGLAWDWSKHTALEALQKGLIVPCAIDPPTRETASGETELRVRWCLGDRTQVAIHGIPKQS